MASTNKTPQLGLNQWAAGDSVLRADFNGDNGKIEAAVEALKARGSCVCGVYYGNGISNHKIDVGFAPHFALVMGVYSNNDTSLCLLMESCTYCVQAGGSVVKIPNPSLVLTKTGFIARYGGSFNKLDEAYHYVVFY